MYKTAVDDIRWLAKRLKGLVEIADLFEEGDILENRIAEAELTLSSLKEDILISSKEKDKLDEDFQREMKNYQKKIEESKTSAEDILTVARSRAETIRQEAEYAAKDTIDKAQLEAQNTLSTIADKDAAIHKLDKLIEVRTQELTRVEKALEDVRKRING